MAPFKIATLLGGSNKVDPKQPSVQGASSVGSPHSRRLSGTSDSNSGTGNPSSDQGDSVSTQSSHTATGATQQPTSPAAAYKQQIQESVPVVEPLSQSEQLPRPLTSSTTTTTTNTTLPAKIPTSQSVPSELSGPYLSTHVNTSNNSSQSRHNSISRQRITIPTDTRQASAGSGNAPFNRGAEQDDSKTPTISRGLATSLMSLAAGPAAAAAAPMAADKPDIHIVPPQSQDLSDVNTPIAPALPPNPTSLRPSPLSEEAINSTFEGNRHRAATTGGVPLHTVQTQQVNDVLTRPRSPSVQVVAPVAPVASASPQIVGSPRPATIHVTEGTTGPGLVPESNSLKPSSSSTRSRRKTSSSASRLAAGLKTPATPAHGSEAGLAAACQAITGLSTILVPEAHRNGNYYASVPGSDAKATRSRRGSRSSKISTLPGNVSAQFDDDEVSTKSKKGSKRQKIKNRLRGLSDVSSIARKRMSGGPHDHDDLLSMGTHSETDGTTDPDGTTDDEDYGSEFGTTRSSMSRMSLPVTGFAVASNKRNQEFHALFGRIDEGDYLIEDYGCALQKDILVHGRIYVSEHHLSFHSNILGWITNLIIAFADITAIEKRMTAYVIPNGISITTRHGKQYVFASFIARDSTYDVFLNVWRQAHSRSPSEFGDDVAGEEEEEVEVVVPPGIANGPGTASSSRSKSGAHSKPAAIVHVRTPCECGLKGEHYPEKCMDAVFPSSPESIYNLMFASQFIREFMSDNQKLMDVQMSEWTPREPGSKLLKRHFSYIKPLNGGIGPKQTKCEITDEVQHFDPNKYVSLISTTKTPDVPSGNVFTVKTRTCLSWDGPKTTRVVVTTKVEWTGRSFIKGIIEKSAVDGQKAWHQALETCMRQYIQENAQEFRVEGQEGGQDDSMDPTGGGGGGGGGGGARGNDPDRLGETGAAVATSRAFNESDRTRGGDLGSNATGRGQVSSSSSSSSATTSNGNRVIELVQTISSGVVDGIYMVSDLIQGLPLTRESLFAVIIAILLVSNMWTWSSLKQTQNLVQQDEKRARWEARVGSSRQHVTPVSSSSSGSSTRSMEQVDVEAAVRAYMENHGYHDHHFATRDAAPHRLQQHDDQDKDTAILHVKQDLHRLEERVEEMYHILARKLGGFERDAPY